MGMILELKPDESQDQDSRSGGAAGKSDMVTEKRGRRFGRLPGPVPHDTAVRRRWIILGLLLGITVINFIDRQTLSIVAPVLRISLHLSNEAYGRIVSAFQFGMMTGEFPMGYLMDRWGTRLGLSLAVLWWSGATGSLALATNAKQFGGVMFWMGTGECGNYSGGVKTIARLFEKRNRTLALGIFNSGSMIGATIATPLVVFLMTRYSYRTAFLVPAALGLLWIPCWWWVRGFEQKETEIVAHQSSRELWGSSSAWAVMMLRFFHGPVLQFYWYWIPLYLATVRHMTMLELGMLAWIPYVLGDSGGVIGGWIAGALRRRGWSMLNVRRWTLFGSGILCLSSAAVPLARHEFSALMVMGFAIMAGNIFSANMFGAITDLVPESQVGRVTGMTGFAGGLSGLLFPLLTGWLVDNISYTPAFILVAIMPLIGAAALFTIGRRYYTAPELALPRDALPLSDPDYFPDLSQH